MISQQHILLGRWPGLVHVAPWGSVQWLQVGPASSGLTSFCPGCAHSRRSPHSPRDNWGSYFGSQGLQLQDSVSEESLPLWLMMAREAAGPTTNQKKRPYFQHS